MVARSITELHTAVVRRADRTPAWASASLIGLLLVAAWALVYATGGTRTAWPHVFYLPIVLASLPFGPIGGLVAAAIAMILCGPVMPLDVASGEPQAVANWAGRGAFFTIVGMLSGGTTQAVRSSFEQGISALLRRELDLAVAAARPDAARRQELRMVLDEGRFHPVFQPIYGLDDGALLAVEALTRFDVEPYQPPNVWFEQAAAAGLGVELELAAIERALEAARTLEPAVALSVNASAQTLADPRLLDLLDRRADRPLIVEVTEHEVVEDYHHLSLALGELRRRGVRLAVDDAGAGFASLRHIVRLAPELIKLDTSLTRDVRTDPIRRALAASLVQFALQIDALLVAEGIEEVGDLEAWQELGAHAAQGYLLARPGPLPVEPFCDRIDRQIHDVRPFARMQGDAGAR